MKPAIPPQKLINPPPLLAPLRQYRERIKAKNSAFNCPERWATWAGFVPSIKIRSGGKIQPMQPWPWQIALSDQVMTDWGDRSSYIFAKSRQCGASEGVISVLLWLALVAGSGLVPGVEAGFTALVASRTQADAWLLGRRLRRMVRSLGITLETDALNLAVFPNGSTIMFRSADPDSVGRGIESINSVFLDEFSFYDEQSRTLEAIAPSMTSVPNSKLFIVSTPNGKGDEFWRLLTTGPLGENELERKLEGIRTETEAPFQIVAGSPRLVLLNWREVYPGDRDFLERIKTELNLTEATVRQEYEMEFVSDSEDFIFPLALVRSCTAGELEPRPDPFGIYYAGVDVATSSQKSSDYTVAAILRKVEGGGFAVANLYRKRAGTSQEHLAAIAERIEAHHPIATTIETNGPGKVWLDSLAGLNLPTTLQGFNTSRPTKESLITRLLLAMERGELTFPDGPITQELLAFKRDPTGKLEAAQGHDDTVMAMGLALAAAGYTGS